MKRMCELLEQILEALNRIAYALEQRAEDSIPFDFDDIDWDTEETDKFIPLDDDGV